MNKYGIALGMLLLAGVLLLLLLLRSNRAPEVPGPREEPSATVVLQSGMGQSSMATSFKTGIIVTSPAKKRAPKEVPSPSVFEMERANKIKGDQKVAPPPTAEESAVSAGQAATTGASSTPQAGVTKLNKRPSPQEAAELNSKGVVMY